jgi:hypothetical protein
MNLIRRELLDVQDAGCGFASPEAPRIANGGDGGEAAGSLEPVGVRCNFDGIDSPCVRQDSVQQRGIGGATFPGEQAAGSGVERFLRAEESYRKKTVKRVPDLGWPFPAHRELAGEPRGKAAHEARLGGGDRIRYRDVCSGLEPLQQRDGELRIVREIRLHDNDDVTLRIGRPANCLTQQHFERGSIPAPLTLPQQCEWQDSRVRLQDVVAFVG